MKNELFSRNFSHHQNSIDQIWRSSSMVFYFLNLPLPYGSTKKYVMIYHALRYFHDLGVFMSNCSPSWAREESLGLEFRISGRISAYYCTFSRKQIVGKFLSLPWKWWCFLEKNKEEEHWAAPLATFNDAVVLMFIFFFFFFKKKLLVRDRRKT